MNYKIRLCKTKDDKKEVQVIYYHNRKTIVAKHLGTGITLEEISDLKRKAETWILEEQDNNGLWSNDNQDNFFKNYEFLGVKYFYAYEYLEKVFNKFNFNKYLSITWKDLVIGRILEPDSKKATLEYLQQFLDKEYSTDTIYYLLSKWDENLKSDLEKEVIRIAKDEFEFNFSFVLYDVTTLYFESFKEYGFQKPGFSKDRKVNQPQIVVGLLVTPEGFPLGYDIWKGNTFEGHTLLPTLLKFKALHRISNLTVVADSAMLSKINFETLEKEGFGYIVGARMGNLKAELLNTIVSQMKSTNGYSKRFNNLVVDFSHSRYLKDSQDLEKQIQKARDSLDELSFRTPKLKYLKQVSLKNYLNEDLIEKHKRLLGLKGYLTNLQNISNDKVIKYYHQLFRVEHAWRIAKSDLEARPIYLQKENSIKNHILICFLALSISIYLELKLKKSIDHIKSKLLSITDAKFLNKVSQKTFYQRQVISEEVKKLEVLSY